jgi:hypothetical protein
MLTNFWSGNMKGRGILQCVSVDERIILKLIAMGFALWTG